MSQILSSGQVQRYHDQGYVVVPALYGDAELAAMSEALVEAVRRDHGEPQPASRYVLMTDVVEEPPLAAQASDPRIVDAVEMLLGGAAALATFVAYLKTPGAAGTGGDYSGSHPEAHQDYKPYHNAGSSLNWLFAIMSLVDLDEQTGPLYVAPGSHKLSRVIASGGRVRRVQRAGAATMAPLMDTGLRRGDLLLMNMFTWHAGGANRSDHNRLGIYNKYRARNAPPGCGPIVFSDAAHRAVVCRGRSLIPHHGDRNRSPRLRLAVERERQVPAAPAHQQTGVERRRVGAAGSRRRRWSEPPWPLWKRWPVAASPSSCRGRASSATTMPPAAGAGCSATPCRPETRSQPPARPGSRVARSRTWLREADCRAASRQMPLRCGSNPRFCVASASPRSRPCATTASVTA